MKYAFFPGCKVQAILMCGGSTLNPEEPPEELVKAKNTYIFK